MPEVLAAIHASGGLDYSRDARANSPRRPKRALAGFDDNEAVAALRGLARYAVSREH